MSASGYVSVGAVRDWINSVSRVAYTTGDFNNDGKADVIISTVSGSYWYFSTGTGTWNVAYDLIITTPTRSYWYYSTGTGTFNTTADQRTDLPLNTVAYTTGNFDGAPAEAAVARPHDNELELHVASA